MRCAAIVLGVTLAASTTAAETPRPLVQDNPHRHVRPTSALGRELIAEGVARSATFRRLVQRLETSDVIVYVQMQPGLPTGVGAVLEFMTAAAQVRFVRVTLGSPNHRLILVSLLAHELQHAAEVADAPDVRTLTQFEALYRRIGHPTGHNRYDSAAARFAGEAVRAELGGRVTERSRRARCLARGRTARRRVDCHALTVHLRPLIFTVGCAPSVAGARSRLAGAPRA